MLKFWHVIRPCEKNTLAETVLINFVPTTAKQLSQATSSPAVLANTSGYTFGYMSLGCNFYNATP